MWKIEFTKQLSTELIRPAWERTEGKRERERQKNVRGVEGKEKKTEEIPANSLQGQ